MPWCAKNVQGGVSDQLVTDRFESRADLSRLLGEPKAAFANACAASIPTSVIGSSRREGRSNG